MTKRSMTLASASLATLLALFAPAQVARADIFEWEYINPANPSQGRQPSTMLTPGGAGATAVPGTNLSSRNLTKAYLIGTDLSAIFHDDYPPVFSDLTGANLSQADLTNANLFVATLTNANLSQANLTNAGLWLATLTGANLTGAEVRGAKFTRTYLGDPSDDYLGGITLAQLYSTASYQAQDLTGIRLDGNNLAGANLVGRNLTNANLDDATLTNANFSQANLSNAQISEATLTNADLSQANLTNANLGDSTLSGANLTGAEIRGTNFTRYQNGGAGIALTQLYSTASYQAHDLTGIGLYFNNLGGANLAGQNLTNAVLVGATLTNAELSQGNLTNAKFSDHYHGANLTGANLSGANLTNAYFAGSFNCGEEGCDFEFGANLTNANLSRADARGANFQYATLAGANTSNLIQSDGHIAGLDLSAGASLVVRDYDGNPYAGPTGPLPIVVEQHLAMDATGTLRLVFDADPWDSTISFAPGIPVTRGGTLELAFADGVSLSTQIGRTIDLVDWTGVTPTGAFTVTSPYTWNLSKLYTTGEVTFTGVPSLPGDFNIDGTVDAADYVVWRKTGINGPTGYDTWRTNFGEPGSSGSGADANTNVPEPVTMVLLMFVAAGWCFRRRRAA